MWRCFPLKFLNPNEWCLIYHAANIQENLMITIPSDCIFAQSLEVLYQGYS